MFPNREFLFVDYVWPTSNDLVKSMRKKCSELISRHHLKSRSQLEYIIGRSRNLFIFMDFIEVQYRGKTIKKECRYSLRFLPDGEKLFFASDSERIQVQVCWWESCLNDDFSPGHFSLCNAHFLSEYANRGEEFGNYNANWTPSRSETWVQPTETLKFPLPSDIAPREKIVAAFVVLCGILWPKDWIDPVITLTKAQRNALANELMNCCFTYNNVSLSYDFFAGTFLYKDLTTAIQDWLPICVSERCFVLAMERRKCCIGHIDRKESWQTNVREFVFVTGGITDIEELDDAVRLKIITEVNYRGQVDISESAHLTTKDGNLIFIETGKRPRCVCLNKGCGYNFPKERHFQVCPNCLFHGMYSVAVSEVTGSTGCVKYFVHIMHHIDDLSKLDFNIIAKEQTYITISDKDFKKGKMKIVYIKHLSQDKDEAYSWKQAIILYMLYEAHLFGIRLQLLNNISNLGSRFWSAFQKLAAERAIIFFPLDKLTSRVTVSKYKLVDSEPVLSKDDFTKTIYRIQVDELTYIGQLSIRSNSGRAGLRYAILSAINGKMRMSVNRLIQRHNIKCLPLDELPVSTVAVVTDHKSSVFQPETLIMLAYQIQDQFFKCHDTILVNLRMSTCHLPSTWFEEVQVITEKLFGKTIGVTGEKTLAFEKSLLSQLGMRR